MPARSEEEKARRKAEYLERAAARKAARELESTVDSSTADKDVSSTTPTNTTTRSSSRVCYFHILPEDTIHIISCFLPARELGALTLTCKALNSTLKEGRISHLLSRVHHPGNIYQSSSSIKPGHSKVSLNLCQDPAEVRVLLEKSLGGGSTGRLVTKKKSTPTINQMYTPPQSQTIETKVAILEEKIHTTDQLMQRIDSAIEKLSEVNSNVTKMLILHEEKINNNEKTDGILFSKIDQLEDKIDRDHTAVLAKLQGLEKKVWVGIGVLAAISFTINNSGLVTRVLTPEHDNGTIERLK
jgi:hypothetical protein